MDNVISGERSKDLLVAFIFHAVLILSLLYSGTCFIANKQLQQSNLVMYVVYTYNDLLI